MVPFHRLLALAGLLALAQAGSSVAAEWSLAADVEQRAEVDDNFRLDDSSEGVLFGTTSTISMRLGARTKLTRWNLSTGAHLSAFAGPGNDTNLDSANPRVNGGVFHQGKRFTANAAFGFSRQSVAFTQFGLTLPPAGSVILPDNTVILPDETVATLDDFDTISNEDAKRNSLDLRGGLTFMVDSLNRLSLSAAGRTVRFSNDAKELEDTTSYRTAIHWAHDLTQRTSTELSFGVSHFKVDDNENTESLSFSTTGGINTKVNPRLTFGFDAGFTVADIQRDSPGRDETPVGFNGSLEVAYELADTNFSLTANHDFEPSTLGELQARSTVGFGVEHSINSRSQVSLSASYSRQVSADNSNDTDRQLFALSPGYSVDITPTWRARAGYTFRLSDVDSGSAISNNFFLSISRTFDLLR